MERYDEELKKLRDLGFPESKCRAALLSASGDVQAAADILVRESRVHSAQNRRHASADIRHNSKDLHKKPPRGNESVDMQLMGDRSNRYKRDNDRGSLPSRDSNQHQSIKLRGSAAYKMASRKSNHYGNSVPINPNVNTERMGSDVNLERERNSDRARINSERVQSRSEFERVVANRSSSLPSLELEETRFYIPHMTLETVRRLKPGDSIDHRDDVGKSLKSRIVGINQNDEFIIHYEGWGEKWDTTSHPIKELWRFSEYKTLSQRQVYRKDLAHLKNGDMIDIYPQKHPGWKSGTIRRLDISKKTGKRISGQVQVQYKAEDVEARSKNLKPKFKDYLYWVHLDNPEEVAPFPTKSAPNSGEAIVNTYQNNQWLEVKIRQNWEPAHVVEVRDNWITVQCERWTSKLTEKLHCVRDKARIRDLGGAIPESQVEKLKREELAMAKEKLQSVGNTLVEMEEDGNCLYRAWAFQIYGDAEKYHTLVRKECCQYIEDNRGYFLHFIPDFDIEMAKKRLGGEWGDQIDIIAMSELYNVPVKIFQLNFEAKALTQTSFGIEELFEKGITKLPQLMLCRHRETHYNAVVGSKKTVPFPIPLRKGNHMRKIREDLERLEKKKGEDSEDEKDIEAKEVRATHSIRNASNSRRASNSFRSYPPRFSVTKVVLPGRHAQNSYRDRSSMEIPSNIVLEED